VVVVVAAGAAGDVVAGASVVAGPSGRKGSRIVCSGAGSAGARLFGTTVAGARAGDGVAGAAARGGVPSGADVTAGAVVAAGPIGSCALADPMTANTARPSPRDPNISGERRRITRSVISLHLQPRVRQPFWDAPARTVSRITLSRWWGRSCTKRDGGLRSRPRPPERAEPRPHWMSQPERHRARLAFPNRARKFYEGAISCPSRSP